jgi:protein TonB
VTPAYPAIARSAHASGEVTVRVLIDKEGKVMAAQVVDGHPLLQAASIKAAKETRFTLTWVEGNQVNVLGQIVYNFVVAK